MGRKRAAGNRRLLEDKLSYKSISLPPHLIFFPYPTYLNFPTPSSCVLPTLAAGNPPSLF